MRALRQSGTIEGAAVAKLLKRGMIKLDLSQAIPALGQAGEQPFGSNLVRIYLGKVGTNQQAAGVAAHETAHWLQKLTRGTYRKAHEMVPYKWQGAVDKSFGARTAKEIEEFVRNNPLYKHVPD